MKRNFFIKIILFIVLIAPYLFSSNDIKKINLQLSWFHQFQFAGYYIAKEKGFYKEENININIKPFDWGVNVPKDVSEGNSDFGIGRETLILEKINNYNNLVSLYPLFQVSPLILLTKEDSGINTVKEFINKKLMATIDDANEVSISAMLKSNNVDLQKIKLVKHSHDINDLILNKVDIISAYTSKTPYNLRKNKINYKIFAPKDYGFDMYSDFLFTNQELINKNTYLVESFKRASLKGWEYAYNNIEESVDLILKKYNSQNLTKEELIFEANELKKLSYYKNNMLGEISKSKLTRILDLYRLMGFIQEGNTRSFNNFIYKKNNSILTEEENNYLKKKTILKMCIQQNNMPYEKIENGQFEGIISKYKELFETKLNIDIDLVIAKDKKQTVSYLEKGLCDMISFHDNVGNKNLFIKHTLPYINLPYVAVSKNSKIFISNFKQLEGTKVLTSPCKALNKTIKQDYPFIHNQKVDNLKHGLLEIKRGNADFLIANIAEVVNIMKDNYFSNLQIVGRFNNEMNHGFALNKEDNILLSILNKTIQNISKIENDNIISDFTNLKFKKIIDYSFTIKIVSIFLVIISLLIFFYRREKNLKEKISILNRTLEDKIKNEVQKNREKDVYLFQQSKLASMGEMIGNIAHQWRQPLNRIILSSQVIESLVKNKNSANDEIIKEKVGHINKNIYYMSETIEDFMNYFQPNKEKKEFYFYHSINKALELMQSRINKIKINLDINKDLTINGYENEFTQIILVLLNNAVDNYEHTEKNNFSIDINVQAMDSYYSITITDNGGGIDIEIMDKIFEPYFTTKFKSEGSGIGLYMAKMMIEQSMNGNIDVYSYDNITSFRIQINKE